MNRLFAPIRVRALALASTALLVFGALAASQASAQSTPGRYAMLPLVAGDTGVPYQVFATKAERTEYANAISAGIQARGGKPIAKSSVEIALAKAGFDQESPYRACETATCAREIGRAVGADSVVFGSVTRALSMIWGSEVSIVDVATGRVRGPYDLGYKGDFLTLETGVGALSHAVADRMIADDAERSHARAMARR